MLINVRFPHNDSKSLILILLYLSNENKKRAAAATPSDIIKKLNTTMDSEVCDTHGMNKMKFGGQVVFARVTSLKTIVRSLSNRSKRNTMLIKLMRRN